MQHKIPILVILGPTASGKTALSLRLARELNGEIISADSRQIYKEIDIGSDKIPVEKQEGIPHHLIGVVSPDQVYTMSDFKRDAEALIEDIYARRKLPVLVGGTGLYIRAMVQNFDLPSVPPNAELRQKFESILQENGEEKGKEILYKMLEKRDPDAAKKIHPNNIPYVTRALEIVEKVGKKSEQKLEPKYRAYVVGIDWPREELSKRIDARVDEQIKRGLIEEARMLLQKYNVKLPSMTSLGAKEFLEYFEGRSPLESVVERLKANTRNYAKRQQTWFRKEPDVHWINGEQLERQPENIVEGLIHDILAAINP